MRIFYKFFWTDLHYNIKWGLKNLKTYFRVVWGSRPWDFNYTSMEMLKVNLEQLLPRIQNGHEVDESRLVKVENITRCIVLIDRLLKDEYVTELGGLNSSKYPFKFNKIDDKLDDEELYELMDYRTNEEKEVDSQRITASIKMAENDWVELWTIIERDARGWWD